MPSETPYYVKVLTDARQRATAEIERRRQRERLGNVFRAVIVLILARRKAKRD